MSHHYRYPTIVNKDNIFYIIISKGSIHKCRTVLCEFKNDKLKNSYIYI